MHQIEYKAQRLEAQKLQLANESSRVYEEYENALDASKIQYGALNADGTTTFLDATLNALENGVVSDYEGPVSGISYLLCDDKHIYVTPAFAAANGITEGGDGIGNKTLKQYLTEHNCPTKPTGHYEQVTDYSNRISVTALNNSVQAPVAGSSVYTKTGSIQAAQDTSIAGSYNYTTVGSIPSAVATAGTTKDVTKILKTTDPNQTYTVSSAEELKTLADLINGYGAETDGVKIVLSNDIDMTGKAWSNIGTFNGDFNGNGYSIKGLKDSLFGTLKDATVQNLKIENSTVNSSSGGAGALAKCASKTSLSNIAASGTVKATSGYAGGLCGSCNDNSTVSKCTFDGTVSGVNEVGGMFGFSGGTITMEHCSVSADVTGKNHVGGMLGYNSGYTTISQSKVAGSVTGATNVGGFIGAANGKYQHCETTANVLLSGASGGFSNVGGFAGSLCGSSAYGTLSQVIYCTSNASRVDSYNTSTAKFVGDAKDAHIESSNALGSGSSAFIGVTSSQTYVNGCYGASSMTSHDGYTCLNSVSSQVRAAYATSYTAPNLQHNATPASSTKVEDISLTNPATLAITGTDEEMKNYLAFKAWNGDSTKSINDFRAEIDSHNYTTQQLAALVNGQSVDAYAGYNITSQVSSNFQVQNNSTAEIKSAKVSSADDILDQLAYDIYVKNGSTGNANATKTQLRNAFSDEQLASLSNHYGKSEWNTIVANLASNINASAVSAYTNDFNGYSLTFNSSDAVQLNAPSSQKGKVTTPSLNAIAKNVVIAMR